MNYKINAQKAAVYAYLAAHDHLLREGVIAPHTHARFIAARVLFEAHGNKKEQFDEETAQRYRTDVLRLLILNGIDPFPQTKLVVTKGPKPTPEQRGRKS